MNVDQVMELMTEQQARDRAEMLAGFRPFDLWCDACRYVLAEPGRDCCKYESRRSWCAFTGRTSRGVRAQTLADYRKRLEQDAIPFLGRLRLSEVEPRDVKALAAHVAARGVAPNTVRLALAPCGRCSRPLWRRVHSLKSRRSGRMFHNCGQS